MEKKIFIRQDSYLDNIDRYIGNEYDFENLVQNNLPTILGLPNSEVFKFKLNLISTFGSGVMADLMLIKNDYSGFSVIEVEIENHSLRRHVIPQILKLREINYELHAEKIYKHLKKINRGAKLDKDKFEHMLIHSAPEFLVISNRYNLDWDATLASQGFNFLAISPYINSEMENCFYVKAGVREDQVIEFPVKWNHYFFSVVDETKTSFKVDSVINVVYEDTIFQFLVEKCSNGYEFYPSGSQSISTCVSDRALNKIKCVKIVGNKLYLE